MTVSGPEDAGGGLDTADFRCLAPPPFNGSIRISQAVTWFRDRLFVGGGRGPLRGSPGRRPDHALGAQIACYDPGSATWDMVYSSPVDHDGAARDRSIRAFAEHGGALWAAAGSTRGQVQLLRSIDGRRFEDCGPPGLGQGDADISSLRNLCSLDGSLYTSPVGMNKRRGWADDNLAERAVILATDDPATGDWREISEPGFGDPENDSVNEMTVFDGTLWAATVSQKSGFQLWRADGLETGRPSWDLILTQGAYRGPANPLPASLCVFRGALFVGSGVQRQPGSGPDRYGPIGPELIRVQPDGSWDVVAGETRLTPDGLKRPLSGRGPGFGDPFVQVFWRMAEHEGYLYLGGSDWRFWPVYLPRDGAPRRDLSPSMQEWLQAETDAWSGDWSMWRSADGVTWDTITTHGLGGNDMQYGLREILSTPAGLWAVPAAKQGTSIGGGIEVWHAGGRSW